MERIDDLQIKGLRIIQNPDKFCFGIDAVLLSDFARVKRGETCVDIGTGTGIIPTLLSAKSEGKKFIGIELQRDMAEMAGRSVALNGLGDGRVFELDEDPECGRHCLDSPNRMNIIRADIRQTRRYFLREFCDVVTCNPPYMNGEGLKNDNESMLLARHEIGCTLGDVLEQGAYMLRDLGRYYMVHRPARLEDVMYGMRQAHLEPKRLRMVHPYVGKDANMVLIEAVKGSKSFMRVEPPLIVYDEPGRYTDEINRIYGRKTQN